jgi:ribulose-phosphate 3-epimerase
MRGAEVEPSLYAADFTRLGEQIRELLEAGARIFHFDVGDGHFVEPVTVGPIVLQAIAPVIHEGGGRIDCHLMVDNPEHHFAQIARAGGDSATFHVEASSDIPATAARARARGLAVGLAFNPGTPVEAALAAATEVDLVLCMSIHPGYSGQEFMPEALDRIRELRSGLDGRVPVQVDGGITKDNVSGVHVAGAELVVAGSAVFEPDNPARAYRELVRELATDG